MSPVGGTGKDEQLLPVDLDAGLDKRANALFVWVKAEK